ncbi:sulfate adenylyltransferase subunit 1 [Bordetella pertussis]|nr:sulfate adenylyltransferase subunit 1 [Bordetella pertussis]
MAGDGIDFSLLTDGLEAEREQGITIDVAYRYFSTPLRKFIIADAPGHEQYTRNMVTGASTADAAIILVDATRRGRPTGGCWPRPSATAPSRACWASSTSWSPSTRWIWSIGTGPCSSASAPPMASWRAGWRCRRSTSCRCRRCTATTSSTCRRTRPGTKGSPC